MFDKIVYLTTGLISMIVISNVAIAGLKFSFMIPTLIILGCMLYLLWRE